VYLKYHYAGMTERAKTSGGITEKFTQWSVGSRWQSHVEKKNTLESGLWDLKTIGWSIILVNCLR